MPDSFNFDHSLELRKTLKIQVLEFWTILELFDATCKVIDKTCSNQLNMQQSCYPNKFYVIPFYLLKLKIKKKKRFMIRYTHFSRMIIKKIHFYIIHLITNGTRKLKLWSSSGGTTCATTHPCGELWLVKRCWWVHVGTPLHQP